MLKNFRDKIALSGITVLMIGVALLIFTFISAYGFLTQSLDIPPGEFVQIFGQALGPLIATCVRIMYLGVMGWIGSLMTIRGVTLIANVPKVEAVIPQKPIVVQQKPAVQKAKEEKPREEAKPPEPEIVVIPPEQVSQPQAEQKQPQKNDSSPQSTNN